MSDVEEPPSKITRVDATTSQNESFNSTEEGQEEWLSEEALTDDDLNTTISTQVRLNDETPSQDELTSTQTTSAESQQPQFELQLSTDGPPKLLVNQNSILSIEETLTNMEKDSSPTEEETKTKNDQENIVTEKKDDSSTTIDDLETFLIQKNAGIEDNTKEVDEKEKVEPTLKQPSHKDDDGGNSTDELLNLLGDDGDKKPRMRTRSKSKSVDKIVQKSQKATLASPESSDEDDEDVFKNAKVTKLKVAKNAVHKRAPPKRVEPEESESDGSTDEGAEKNRMFRSRRKSTVKSKGTTTPAQTKSVLKSSQTPAKIETQTLRTADKKQLPGSYGIKNVEKRSETPTKSKIPTSLSKMPSTSSKLTSTVANAPSTNRQAPSSSSKTTSSAKGTPSSAKETSSVGSRISSGGSAVTSTPHKKAEKLKEELIHEDYLDDDDDLDEDMFVEDLDEQEAGTSKNEAGRQRVMKPEEMDEEMPSDDMSDDTDESFYDDIPSSDSDGVEEWFTLDLRAEKAGDYIPLLDRKAYVLLEEEKESVAKKLETLKHSLQALNESSKNNIAEIEQARRKITELDGMLAQP